MEKKEKRFLSSISDILKKPKLSSKLTKVIKASNVILRKDKVKIIGGDDVSGAQEHPPVIVIERDKDRISKIIVTCPCGRHAELICEYDDRETSANNKE